MNPALKKLAILALSIIFLSQDATAKLGEYEDGGGLVWNQTLGKLVPKGESPILDTSKQQFDLIQSHMEKGDTGAALKACDDFIKYFPTSKYVPEVYFKLGNLLEEEEDYYKAFKFYQELFEKHPNNSFVNRILYRQFEIGKRFMGGERYRIAGVPTIRRPGLAVEIFQTIKNNVPFHEYGEKAQYFTGRAYEEQGKYKEAQKAYEDLLDEYPNTKYASEVSFRIANVVYKIAEVSREREKAINAAQEKISEHIGKFPKSDSVGNAKKLESRLIENETKNLYEVGRFYEKRHYLESAVIYYQEAIEKGPNTRWATLARERIAVFEDPRDAVSKGKEKLSKELTDIESEINYLEKRKKKLTFDEKVDYKVLKDQQKALKENLKKYDKNKFSEVEYRWEVYERKQKELNQRKKTLKKKKASLTDIDPKELADAVRQWEQDIQEEEIILNQEKENLMRLSDELGYERGGILPLFASSIDDINLDRYILYKSARLAKLEGEKESYTTSLDASLEERETLLKTMKDLKAQLDVLASEKKDYRSQLAKEREQVYARETKLEEDSKRLQNLISLYSQKRGDGLIRRVADAPGKMMRASSEWLTALASDNPKEALKSLEKNKERVAKRSQSLKDSLSDIDSMIKRFEDTKLETKKLTENAKAQTSELSERELSKKERAKRRKVKAIEKEINEQYRRIEDLEKQRAEQFEKLKETIKIYKSQRKGMVGQTLAPVTKPFKAFGRGFYYFIYGLGEEEAKVQTEADELSEKTAIGKEDIKMHQEEMESLKEQIKIHKEKLKSLYKDLEKEREGDSSGLFKSILIFPTNIFKTEGEKEDIQFLLKVREKKESELSRVEQSLKEINREIEKTQKKIKVEEEADREMVRTPTDDDDGAKLKQEIKKEEKKIKEEKKELKSYKKLFKKHPIEKEVEKAFSKRTQDLHDSLEGVLRESDKLNDAIADTVFDKMDILKAEEEVNRKKLERIEKVISKFEGSVNLNMKRLQAERKNIFKTLDQIATDQASLEQILASLEI